MVSWRRLNPIHIVLFAIYPATVSLALLFLRSEVIPLVLSVIILFGLFRGSGRLTLLSSYAYAVYLFGSAYPEAMPLALTYPLLLPLLLSDLVNVGVEYTGFLGPSARRLLTISLLYVPLTVLRPHLALFFSIQYIWLVFLVGLRFIQLREARLEDAFIPRNMVLNRGAKITLSLSSPREAYFLIRSNWGYRDARLVSGEDSVTLVYSPHNVGAVNIDIAVYALDRHLLSSRLVETLSREISVAPTTLVNIRYILRGLGELLARAGLPRVVGLLGAGAGEEGRGAGVRGLFGEGALGRFLRGLFGVGEEGLARRRRGTDYLGVREFLTGDRPKDIHWKKSISRGMFFVKVFGGGGGGGGGFGASLIVVGDLLASSPEELDEITNKILLTLYSQARRGMYGVDTILILVSPFNEVLYARGRLEQILSFYIEVFQRGLVKVLYDYNSFERVLDVEEVYDIFRVGREVRFLRVVSSVSSNLARKVLGVVESIGYEYTPNYTVVSGRPGGMLVQHLRLLFSLSGYRFVDYNELVARVEPLIPAG